MTKLSEKWRKKGGRRAVELAKIEEKSIKTWKKWRKVREKLHKKN